MTLHMKRKRRQQEASGEEYLEGEKDQQETSGEQ